MKKTTPVFAVLVVAFAAEAALTSTWTGAVSGSWTNAANWTAGVPGQYVVAGGVTNGETGCTAIFSSVAQGAATTINLDGLVGIKFLTVTGADAPQYTFGTKSTQILPMEGWGGKFLVESSVETPPLLTCGLGLGLQIAANMNTYIENNATTALVINNFGYWTQSIPSSPTVYIHFSGSGPVRIAGKSTEVNKVYAYYYFYLDGLGDLEIATSTFEGQRRLSQLNVPAHVGQPDATNVVRIAAGYHFLINQSAGTGISAQGNLLFSGDGYLQLRGGVYANNIHSTAISAGAGKTIEVASKCDGMLATSASATICGLVATGRGRTIISGVNEIAGRIDVIGDTTTLEVGSIGLKGASSALGTGDAIRLSGNSRLLYTGTGETTDREIQLGSYTSKGGVIEHAGSGTLTFASSVTQTAADVTLRLHNDTAYDAVWSGNIADNPYSMNISKTGTGRWIFTGANTYSGTTTLAEGTLRLDSGGSLVSAVTFSDGTELEVVAGTGGMTGSLSLVAPSSGAATLSVEGSGTISVASLSGSIGVLNIVADPSDVSVVFTGVSAGGAPRYLHFNGEAAAFDADGRLVVRSFDATDEIAARGGVIPNGAAKSVAIASAGTSGPITLENGADATIAALGQLSGTEAVVSLADGRTLTLSALFLDEGAANLSIGTVPGEGTLAAASGDDLELENKSASSVLTVNAALSVPQATDIVKAGEGKVRIASGFDHAGDLVLHAGSFAVSNATTLAAHLQGTGTFIKEGDESWQLSTAQPDFSGDFVLAGGYNYLISNGVFGDSSGRLVVTNGATLDLSSQFGARLSQMRFEDKAVAISGEGFNGMGALRFGTAGGTDDTYGSSAYAFKRLSLLGDTLIGVTNTYGNLGMTGSAADPFVFDMNGHALVKRGGGGLRFEKGIVTNPGPILAESDIANNYSNIQIYPDADLGGDDSIPLTLATRAGLFCNRFSPQRRKLVVQGPDVRVTYSSASHNMTTNLCNWAGPVVLSDSLSVRLRTGASDPFDFMFTLSGPVSGPGGIAVAYRSRLFLANENNTFEGSLTLAGADFGTLRARYPGSIPDASKVTINNGRIAVCAPHWTAADIANLATNATFSTSYSFLAVNTEDAEDCAWTLAPGNTLSASGISHEGKGTLTVVGPITEPLRYASHGGTLKFSGTEPILLGLGVLCQDPGETNEAVVVLEDASDIRMANDSSVTLARIGVNWTTVIGQDRTFARVRVRNARVTRNAFEASGDVTAVMMVGYSGRGILEVEDGAFITNLVQAASSANSIGAIYMRGGELYNWSTGSSSSDMGIRGSAYLEVAGGDYICGCGITGVGRFTESHSVVNICGGRLSNTAIAATLTAPRAFIVGRQGHGHMRISRGSFTTSGDMYVCEAGSYSGAGGIITVEDEGEFFCNVGLHLANQTNSTAILNLNGGELRATYIRGYGPTRGGSTSYVNCSGGTLKLGVSSLSAFRDATRVTLYDGGLSIDTDGNNRLVNEPLCAPSGNGVTAIPSGWWSVTNYVGSPYVEIIGSGTGAAAYADFDSARGEVTAIRVVSPGCGYGNDTKAVLYWGTLALTNAVSVGPVAGGGFTKKGAGTLTLNATNTYTGATAIQGGTLKLGCDWAVPSNSTVTVAAGATLDLNGKAFSPGNVSGAGTITGATTAPSEWIIDLEDVMAGSYTKFNGTVTFPAGARIVLLNADKADKKDRRYLLAQMQSFSGVLPEVVDEDGNPLEKWQLLATGGKLRLSYPSGTAISFR